MRSTLWQRSGCFSQEPREPSKSENARLFAVEVGRRRSPCAPLGLRGDSNQRTAWRGRGTGGPRAAGALRGHRNQKGACSPCVARSPCTGCSAAGDERSRRGQALSTSLKGNGGGGAFRLGGVRGGQKPGSLDGEENREKTWARCAVLRARVWNTQGYLRNKCNPRLSWKWATRLKYWMLGKQVGGWGGDREARES